MESKNLPIYKYEPLPLNEGGSGHWIRVFDLLPSDKKEDQIVVRLRTISLAKVSPKRSRQYDTISYVWGEESENDEDVLIIHEGKGAQLEVRVELKTHRWIHSTRRTTITEEFVRCSSSSTRPKSSRERVYSLG